MIYGHGDDLYESDVKIAANFSTNVWYENDVELLRKVLMDNVDKIFHYPEPDAGSLKQVVADYHGVKSDNVLIGNGATELLYLITRALGGGNVLIPVPSFREYEDAALLNQYEIRFLSQANVSELPDEDIDLTFICNPNNPDGRVWTEAEIIAILDFYPKGILVVDESFIHFAPAAMSAEHLLPQYPNLLIVRSMTKNYAIPGLRLGYMIGAAELIKTIARYKQPWSVNALAIEVGKFLLKSGNVALPDAQELLNRQKKFALKLGNIPGFYPQPSQTSFFLVRTDYDVAELKSSLLKKQGILIRDASNFRELDSHYFRINTLDDKKNAMLIKALTEYAG